MVTYYAHAFLRRTMWHTLLIVPVAGTPVPTASKGQVRRCTQVNRAGAWCEEVVVVEDTSPSPHLRAHGAPSAARLHAALEELRAAGWVDRVVAAPLDGDEAVQV